MFTSFQKVKFSSLVTGLVLVAASSLSAANQQPAVAGVIQSVDYTENKLTVVLDQTGEIATYGFKGEPRITINGKKSNDIRTLEAGQKVFGKFTAQAVENEARVIKGQIVSIDLEQNTALIRSKNGGRQQLVSLPQNVVVRGLHEGAGAADLQKGHLVTLKYTSR